MPRELEGYRPQLELLTDMFPGRAAIGITECQAALGIDRRTLLADRRFPARPVRRDRDQMLRNPPLSQPPVRHR